MSLSNVMRAASAEPFARGYLDYVAALIRGLDAAEIAGFIAALERARAGESTIFIIGNGGSAATASHMANDFGMSGSPGNRRPIRAHALTDNVPLLTAIANDHDYRDVFVRQLDIHYRDGDVLLAISASGNSPNVVAAAEWIRDRKGLVLGLLGFDGGRLRALCGTSVLVRTPPGEYGPVEDVHMILDHLVTMWLRADPPAGESR